MNTKMIQLRWQLARSNASAPVLLGSVVVSSSVILMALLLKLPPNAVDSLSGLLNGSFVSALIGAAIGLVGVKIGSNSAMDMNNVRWKLDNLIEPSIQEIQSLADRANGPTDGAEESLSKLLELARNEDFWLLENWSEELVTTVSLLEQSEIALCSELDEFYRSGEKYLPRNFQIHEVAAILANEVPRIVADRTGALHDDAQRNAAGVELKKWLSGSASLSLYMERKGQLAKAVMDIQACLKLMKKRHRLKLRIRNLI